MAKRTTNPGRRRWREACGWVVLSAILLAFSAAQPVRAADPGTATPSQPSTVAALEYSEAPNGVINAGVSTSPRSAPFKKEPASTGGRIIRGTLNLGGPSNNLAFLWQREAGKLFLDLNRNQDLTDDPAGVFFTGESRPSNYQTFKDIHLQLSTPAGICPVLADIHFWDFGSSPSCSVELRSFWQAKVTLAGQDWQVGIVQNLSNPADSCDGDDVLLRAWDKHNATFRADGNALDAFPFSQKIFAGGHAYELKWLPMTPANGFKPRLQFTEQTVALGDLKLTGQFIQRLMLPGVNGYLVICDRPSQTVKVPTGDYSTPEVLLEQNGVQAYCKPIQWQPGKKFSVTARTPATLAVGGPLTNSVEVTRHGAELRLNYQLLGAGGQVYHMMRVDSSQPPGFAIYKGEKQIASGTFEFG